MIVDNDIHATNGSYEGRDLEVLACLDHYRRWILSDIEAFVGGRTVEIGAGTGNFSELLLPLARELVLVEPAARPFCILSRRFRNEADIELHRCDGAGWARNAPAESADSIVMINVLEHVEDDAGFLRGLYRTLRPGGTLIVFVPALMALYGALDRRHGHFRRYHRRQLRDRLADAGFDVVKGHYFDSAGAIAWFVVYRLLGATSFDPRLARIYDVAAVPVLRRIESVFRPPVGKNLIFVCRRSRSTVKTQAISQKAAP